METINCPAGAMDDIVHYYNIGDVLWYVADDFSDSIWIKLDSAHATPAYAYEREDNPSVAKHGDMCNRANKIFGSGRNSNALIPIEFLLQRESSYQYASYGISIADGSAFFDPRYPTSDSVELFGKYAFYHYSNVKTADTGFVYYFNFEYGLIRFRHVGNNKFYSLRGVE